MTNETIVAVEPAVMPLTVAPTPAPTPAPTAAPEKLKAEPDKLLVSILSTRRCYNSSGDISMRSWIIKQLEAWKVKHRVAILGNIVATVGKKSTTLFSCHTDTVHTFGESNTVQKLTFDPDFGHIFLQDKKSSTCLGADDGAGIWMLLNMIKAKVPGTYVFHVGEEKGGMGSRAFLKEEPHFLEKFDRAIAFDRADNFEIIITQGGVSCASAEFGKALANELYTADKSLKYENSHKGTFTDTKVYNGVIPECVNIGVGYMFQHGPDEYQDVEHLTKLLNAAIMVNWENLKPVRKVPVSIPSAKDYSFPGVQSKFPSSQSRFPNGFTQMDDYDYENDKIRDKPSNNPPKTQTKGPSVPIEEEIFLMAYDEIENLCMEDPEIAAEAIRHLLVTLEMEKAKNETLTRLYMT